MPLKETVSNVLTHLHFRSKPEPEVKTEIEPDYCRYWRMPKEYVNPAEYPKSLTNELEFGAKPENVQLFSRTVNAIKNAFENTTWDKPILKQLDEGGPLFYRSPRVYFEEHARSMYIPTEVMEKAPPALRELIKLANITPKKIEFLNIRTEGIPAQISYYDKAPNFAAIQIGDLVNIGDTADANYQRSQQLVFKIDLDRKSSNIELDFLASDYTPSKELSDHLQSLSDETTRAKLFSSVAWFLASCLNNPDIIRTPFKLSVSYRWHKEIDMRNKKAIDAEIEKEAVLR